MEQRLLRLIIRAKNARDLNQIHQQAIVHGLRSADFLLPKFIDLSSSFHSPGYAIRMLDDAWSPNVVAHNTMIKRLVELSRCSEALTVYSKMKLRGVRPNNFTFTFLLKVCEAAESLRLSGSTHAQILTSGFGSYVFVQNALLSTYSKCGKEMDTARRLFDEMRERDVISWNSIVGAYIARGDLEQAMSLFELMPERNIISWNSVLMGVSRRGDMALAQSIFERMEIKDTVSWNTMISGYVTIGDTSAAQSIFDHMEGKDAISWTTMISAYMNVGNLGNAKKLFLQMPVKTVVSWNAMISGYNKNHLFDEALKMFQLMLLEEKFPPDEATLTTVVSACAQLGSLEHGNWIHSYIKKNAVHLTVALGNSLIDMFAKCGDIISSESVFNQMSRRCVVTWTTMLSGLAYNGNCREALTLFNRMGTEGVGLDDVVFIAVLSACTHGGFVGEGKVIFNQMIGKHGIIPRMEHYGCMVDLLGRAGKLNEAVAFLQNMPMKPNAVLWATLLSSCVAHGAQYLIEFVSQKIIELEPSNSCYQVLVSNSIALKGRWDCVGNIRALMRQEGIEKVPGCSSIQVDGEVHEFLVKDTRHRKRKEIYEILDGLTQILRQMSSISFRDQFVLTQLEL